MIMIPKWLIEENPIIFRVDIIVIPLKAIAIEFKIQNRINLFCLKIIIITEIGMIFWTVKKISLVFHLIFSIHEINQKWKGNKPNFVIMANKIKK